MNTLNSESQIIPVLIGENARTLQSRNGSNQKAYLRWPSARRRSPKELPA